MPYRLIPAAIWSRLTHYSEDVAYLLAGASGLAAMHAPSWFEWLNQLLMNADGFYKFGIFLATFLALMSRRSYYKKKGSTPGGAKDVE